MTAKKVVVIDYGRGNLRSVVKALEAVGARAEISSSAKALDSASGLILPGVGAFGDAMGALKRGGLVKPLKQAVAAGKPLLGICLGLQLFFEKSFEFGIHQGLGFFKGSVRRFQGRIKIPHMGWNQVRWTGTSPLLAGLPQDESFYFVHSYRAQGAEPAWVAGTTKYGQGAFPSVMSQGSLFATQFHPEKSQKAGLKIYANFRKLVEKG
jgi:glutamine amidotransferase